MGCFGDMMEGREHAAARGHVLLSYFFFYLGIFQYTFFILNI